MSQERMHRRLEAILLADVVGYSRLRHETRLALGGACRTLCEAWFSGRGTNVVPMD
jgi:hypothetical protein